MGKTIQQRGILTTGVVALGERSGVAGSVTQQVHDGDTILVHADNFGVRFLGVDTPEISFSFPVKNAKVKPFVGLSDPRWGDFLEQPFDEQYGEFQRGGIDIRLVAWLRKRTGRKAAMNHYRNASLAERTLEAEVTNDMRELGQTEETFRFFIAFASELIDRYGRFLCYIRPNQPDVTAQGGTYKSTYNERLLAQGMARPYFIWPNVNPFRKQLGLRDSVFAPGKLQETARRESTLRQAREAVADARKSGRGTFSKGDALMLEPFELRYLARRQPPDRWVIDLSKDDDELIAPQQYYTVSNPEDRLFVPDDYIPLFVEKKWRVSDLGRATSVGKPRRVAAVG